MRKGITKTIFLEILEETKSRLLSIKGGLKKMASGLEFEAILYNEIREVCAERGIRDHQRTGKQTFPDMFIWPYGIEAKFTVGDKWISTGNSIVESTRIPDLKEIYMFFYRQGNKGQADIRFKSYSECLSDIIVTHSPRYRIDMDLSTGSDIFSKMGIAYDKFREDDTIKLAKEYYKSTLGAGEELWWIDQDDEGMSPVIKNYSELDRATQKRFRLESMVYFPEIFSSSSRKYLKASLHLLSKYQATSSALRDKFTAAGQKDIKLKNGTVVKVPKIFYHLHIHAKEIKTLIGDLDPVAALKIWGIRAGRGTNLELLWLSLLDEKAAIDTPKASIIYKSGL